MAAVICSASVLSFGETAASHGGITTVFGDGSRPARDKADGGKPEPEKIGNINFEKESEDAPTTNQARPLPDDENVLDESPSVEAGAGRAESERASAPAEETPPADGAQGLGGGPTLSAQERSADGPSEKEAAGGEALPEAAPIAPSRSVTIKKSQYLDVAYAGGGWSYIGESSPDRLMTFFGRASGKDGTVFTLRSKKAGTTLLHFYKSDNLTGEYIDDYLAVTVEDEPSVLGDRVTAPHYADVVPARPARRLDDIVGDPVRSAAEGAPSDRLPSPEPAADEPSGAAPAKDGAAPAKDDVSTVIENTTGAALAASAARTVPDVGEPPRAAAPAEEAPDASLLEAARRAFEGGDFESALDRARRQLGSGAGRDDEALYLLGQIYESESPVRNIRSAIDSYDALVRDFPQSPLWERASRRSVYLKRFYIDIR